MGAHSKIEWTDHTFNPWIGCTRISAACDHCYAADLARRHGWAKFEAGAPRHRTSAAYWQQPLAWNRKAAANGVRARVFCASLADVFDAEVPDAWRAELLELVGATPDLDWQLLTKRPHLAAKYFAGRKVPSNVLLGTTAENMPMARLRIGQLVEIRARRRFLSLEPLLGPIDLEKTAAATAIDWVIAGGESGPHARPSHPDWFRALRDQCRRAGVPFFFKQWGEWGPDEGPPANAADTIMEGRTRCAVRIGDRWEFAKSGYEPPPAAGDGEWAYRIGKKRAGALLDGREHREFPI